MAFSDQRINRHGGWVWVWLFLVFAQANCGSSPDLPDEQASNGTGVQSIPVTTATAEVRTVPAYLPATGSFQAAETSDVAPQLTGQITATPVDVGAFVPQGAVIARLDDRDARLRLAQTEAAERQAEAALRQAQARLGLAEGGRFNPAEVPEVRAARQQYEAAEAQAQLAEANAARYAALIETGDVARSVYDQARAQAATARAQANAARQQYEAALNAARQSNQGVAAAQAALAGARAQTALARKTLNDTVIRAPLAGHISDYPAAVGESVTPTTKIATIQRLRPIKLQLQLPEAEAGQVRIGMPVTASVAAYPDREFTGQVTALNPALNPASRTVSVEAQLPNPTALLRPGMFATARLLRAEGEQVVFVPPSAVLHDPSTNSARVFVLEGNVARVRVVQTSPTKDGLVRVTAGLSGGETVITSNLAQLFDGVIVNVATPTAALPGSP